jgi:hypothetical protein
MQKSTLWADFPEHLLRGSQKPSFLREIRLGIEGRLWVECVIPDFALPATL